MSFIISKPLTRRIKNRPPNRENEHSRVIGEGHPNYEQLHAPKVHPPHSPVEAAGVEVPDLQALGHAQPRVEVTAVPHLDIQDVGLHGCIVVVFVVWPTRWVLGDFEVGVAGADLGGDNVGPGEGGVDEGLVGAGLEAGRSEKRLVNE